MITYSDVRNDEEVKAIMYMAESQIEALGFTEHSVRHSSIVSKWAGEILEQIGADEHRVELARIAGFLHDIGKFSTWTIEEDTGRHRFIKHDAIGAKLAENLLKEMKFSNKQIKYITAMIKNHIYPSQLMTAPEIDFDTPAGEKAMMRFIRKTEDNVIDNIILAMADRLSARGEAITDEMVENNISALKKLLSFYLKIKDSLEPLPVLLDGNEVMKILNIKPSKQLGEIMNALHEAQLSGDVTTKEQAVEFINNYAYHG